MPHLHGLLLESLRQCCMLFFFIISCAQAILHLILQKHQKSTGTSAVCEYVHATTHSSYAYLLEGRPGASSRYMPWLQHCR